MTASSKIAQILAYLPNAGRQSKIYVCTGEQEGTWDVFISDKGDINKRPFWEGLLEDPAPAIEKYVAANPDQQLQVRSF